MNKSLCKDLQDVDYRNKHVEFSVCKCWRGDLWLGVGEKNTNLEKTVF